MMPVTSLMFAAAILAALLLPEYELRVFDGYWQSPRETLVDLTIGSGLERCTATKACALLPGLIMAPDDDGVDDDDE